MQDDDFLLRDDFDFLLNKDFDVLLVDIEETVLAPNMCCEMILDKDFYKKFLISIERNNVIEHKLSDIIYVGKNFRRMLMDSKIPKIFSQLQQRGTKIFALSSGFQSNKKVSQLSYLDVHFDELFFTKRGPKGLFLQNLFENKKDVFEKMIGKTMNEIKIAVIDNHRYKLKNIKDYLHGLNVTLVLYTNQHVPMVTTQDFKNYWIDVIRNMQNFRGNRHNINGDNCSDINK
jgi:hypothetical protein